MIAPQSANWTTLATQRDGRGMRLLAHIEGIADPVCNFAPADAWSKTYSISATGHANATANYIDCGSSTALTQLTDWTICIWFKTSSSGAGHLAGSWDDGASKGFRINLSGDVAIATWTGGTRNITSTVSVAQSTWYFLAISVGGLDQTVTRAVWDDTNYGPYYDSTIRSSRNSWTGSTPFLLFSANSALDGIDGSIGYCAVFNRALTHREMRAVKYRRIDKKLGDDDSGGLYDCCVAEYQAERGAGATLVNNRNPGTHDGTLNGDAAWVASAPFAVTYRPVLAAGISTGQEIDPLATRTSIQSTTLRLLDTDEWLTRLLQSTSLGLMRRGVSIYLGFDGLLESEYQPITKGRIGDIRYDAHVYELDVSDALFGAKQKVTLGKGTLQSGINNAVTSLNVEVSRYFFNSTNAGKVGYAKIDSEIVAVGTQAGVSASVQSLATLTRGSLSSTAASHSSGAIVSEVMLVDLAPLSAALYLLLSGGGNQSATAYDILVESAYTDATTFDRRGRGANLSPSEVAISEVVALPSVSTFSSLAPYIEEDVEDLKDWIESEVLRPAGCYFAVKPDGRLTVRSLKVPTSSDVIYELRPDRFLWTRLEATEGQIVNYLELTYSYNILTQATTGILVQTNAASGTTYGLRRRSFDVPASTSSADLTTVAGWILQRFAQPYVTFTVECGLWESLLEIGDAVYLLDAHLPNLSTGYRGVAKLLCQVIGRKFDVGSGRTQLTLVDCSRM